MNGMLLTEAALGAVSVAAYAVLAWWWRVEAPVTLAEAQAA